MEKIKQITDRIPYDTWVNSQLSVARFYGGIDINGKHYIFDPECEYDENDIGKPDLITYDI